MSKVEVETIREKLKRSVCSENGILNFTYAVDRSLLGGFRVEIDGTVKDFSFTNQVQSWDKIVKDEQARKDQYITSIPKFLY